MHCNITGGYFCFFLSIHLPCQAVAKITYKNIYVNSCCKEKASVKYPVTTHKIRATRRNVQTSDFPKFYYPWFSMGRRGAILPPEDTWQCLWGFRWSQLGECTGIWWVKARAAAKHPTVHRTGTHSKKITWFNMSTMLKLRNLLFIDENNQLRMTTTSQSLGTPHRDPLSPKSFRPPPGDAIVSPSNTSGQEGGAERLQKCWREEPL